jgi:hypothetical protein
MKGVLRETNIQEHHSLVQWQLNLTSGTCRILSTMHSAPEHLTCSQSPERTVLARATNGVVSCEMARPALTVTAVPNTVRLPTSSLAWARTSRERLVITGLELLVKAAQKNGVGAHANDDHTK